ncbi:hypothetical protein ACJX0J_021822, partial [Zea mays]
MSSRVRAAIGIVMQAWVKGHGHSASLGRDYEPMGKDQYKTLYNFHVWRDECKKGVEVFVKFRINEAREVEASTLLFIFEMNKCAFNISLKINLLRQQYTGHIFTFEILYIYIILIFINLYFVYILFCTISLAWDRLDDINDNVYTHIPNQSISPCVYYLLMDIQDVK